MKMNTLQKVYDALRTEEPELTLSAEIREKARIPLQRMLDWSRN
jgi:quinolinate synthase